MTLESNPASVVAIVSGNAIVGRALEVLLRSAQYSVRLLADPSFDKPGLLDGVQLLLLAPGLDAVRHETLLGTIDGVSSSVRVPVLELVDATQAAQAGDGHCVSWPCRSEDLKREIKAALFAGSEDTQSSHEAGRDGQGVQNSKTKGGVQ